MVSSRARFALHGLAFLAGLPAGESASFSQVFTYLRSWSERLVLSKGYVSKIFQDLSRAGLVRAVPGRSGDTGWPAIRERSPSSTSSG